MQLLLDPDEVMINLRYLPDEIVVRVFANQEIVGEDFHGDDRVVFGVGFKFAEEAEDFMVLAVGGQADRIQRLIWVSLA